MEGAGKGQVCTVAGGQHEKENNDRVSQVADPIASISAGGDLVVDPMHKSVLGSWRFQNLCYTYLTGFGSECVPLCYSVKTA